MITASGRRCSGTISPIPSGAPWRRTSSPMRRARTRSTPCCTTKRAGAWRVSAFRRCSRCPNIRTKGISSRAGWTPRMRRSPRNRCARSKRTASTCSRSGSPSPSPSSTMPGRRWKRRGITNRKGFSRRSPTSRRRRARAISSRAGRWTRTRSTAPPTSRRARRSGGRSSPPDRATSSICITSGRPSNTRSALCTGRGSGRRKLPTSR